MLLGYVHNNTSYVITVGNVVGSAVQPSMHLKTFLQKNEKINSNTPYNLLWFQIQQRTKFTWLPEQTSKYPTPPFPATTVTTWNISIALAKRETLPKQTPILNIVWRIQETLLDKMPDRMDLLKTLYPFHIPRPILSFPPDYQTHKHTHQIPVLGQRDSALIT